MTEPASWTPIPKSEAAHHHQHGARSLHPRGHEDRLLDTPGFADFAGDQHAALRVADAAIVFVDSSAGVQVGTQTVWSELDKAETPRVVVAGRLDRENADFDRVLEQLRESYGIRVVALHVPVGEHQELSATIDLLHGQILKGPKDPVADLPKEEADRVGVYRQQLVEAIVETDEDSSRATSMERSSRTTSSATRSTKRCARGRSCRSWRRRRTDMSGSRRS